MYRGRPSLITAARFPWFVTPQICPYLWRMEEKAKRRGGEQDGGSRGRRRQAAAAGRTARPRPPARVLIYSAKGRRQACAPYRQHGRRSGEAGRAERQSGRQHGRRRSKAAAYNSIIYNYYIYNYMTINYLYYNLELL